ncbi:reverse transcriptase domain-containing protein [Tanacetum coccineum]|uniref:Reverse transcriptase domain-containing protein n=1 Tax=Tanacetum coccineum TaxID=301880 RepID=A0ABQ5B103_9ASTR
MTSCWGLGKCSRLVVQQKRISVLLTVQGFGLLCKECRKTNALRVKNYSYHKEKMMMCKQAEQGVPLQAEQADWLADTDEEIDEQELEAHYSFMAKIQEVLPEESSSTEQPLDQELKNEFKTSMTNQNNEIKNMLSNFLQIQSPSGSGSLPSNTVANPRGDVKAITTRSGVSYDGPTIPPTPSPLPKEVERETEVTKDKVQNTSLESTAHVQPPVVQDPIPEPEVAPKPKPKPSIPYPSRLNDQKLREKANNQMLKFLQIFQRLHFDIGFADALLHMPKFASTFKSLLSNKEKLFELANTPLNENCSALDECLALADLGASINLIPLSMWKQLSLPELTSTRMTLELADRSVAHPKGVAEDVPLILGRPFLRTARALIDVYGEELTLRVNDEAITFKVGHTSRYSRNYYDETVHQVNVIDVACEEYAQEVLGFSDSSTSGNPTPSDPIIASSSPSFTPFEGGDFILEQIETYLRTPEELSNLDDDYYDTEGDILYLEKLLNEDPSLNLPPMKNDDLKQVDVTMTKPSIEEPPELELKDLPSYLEYAFLEGTNKLPVIIPKELKEEEKATLLKVLKSHKRAIAWKIFDIKGIDPSFCTYKILMEDDFKPAVQHQRRVNPKIHEIDFTTKQFRPRTIRQDDVCENVTSGLVPQGQRVDYDNSGPDAPKTKLLFIQQKKKIRHIKGWNSLQYFNEEYYTQHTVKLWKSKNDQCSNASFQMMGFINPFLFSGTRSCRPKNIKDAMADSAWIKAMQEELHQFDRLKVWELVDKPFGKMIIKLKWLWKNKKDEDQTGHSCLDISRPDIVQAVCYCARYRARPTTKATSRRMFMSDALILAKALLDEYSSLVMSYHKVVRLGINPMIQPEPEDLPKDNPKLEIAVLRTVNDDNRKGHCPSAFTWTVYQENTTFTCPYGTFAYRCMPFGLCNALSTFQRCMMDIFHDMIEETMEVFMDDFLVFGDSFYSCLSHLDKMLKRCKNTNLVLNWEKCHFMVKEGIVLSHKISKSKIEVDRAKVDVIAKLPHPTSVKRV